MCCSKEPSMRRGVRVHEKGRRSGEIVIGGWSEYRYVGSNGESKNIKLE
jgi:hypothetical protein